MRGWTGFLGLLIALSPAVRARAIADGSEEAATGASRGPEPGWVGSSDQHRVWSETGTARVKTIYDAQGNIVYQKAWDKATGREVPLELTDPAPGTSPETLALHEPTEARPYGLLRQDPDGAYEQDRTDPRPAYRRHQLNTYPAKPERHPYEFSLHGGFWVNYQDGTLEGTAGGGQGSLVRDQRTTYMMSINNQRAGFGLTQIKHRQGVTGAFSFLGTAFNANGGAVFDSNVVIYDSFYRWHFSESRDAWIDYLLGIKVLDFVLRADQGNLRAETRGIAPLGQAGLIGQYALLDNIHWRGFIKAAGGGFSGASGVVIDGEVEFVYTFPGDREYSRFNQFSAGWKLMNLSFTSEDDAGEASGSILTHGPFFQFSSYF